MTYDKTSAVICTNAVFIVFVPFISIAVKYFLQNNSIVTQTVCILWPVM